MLGISIFYSHDISPIIEDDNIITKYPDIGLFYLLIFVIHVGTEDCKQGLMSTYTFLGFSPTTKVNV